MANGRVHGRKGGGPRAAAAQGGVTRRDPVPAPHRAATSVCIQREPSRHSRHSARTCCQGQPTQRSGAPGGIRTHDHRLRRAVLYPAELRAQWRRARRAESQRRGERSIAEKAPQAAQPADAACFPVTLVQKRAPLGGSSSYLLSRKRRQPNRPSRCAEGAAPQRGDQRGAQPARCGAFSNGSPASATLPARWARPKHPRERACRHAGRLGTPQTSTRLEQLRQIIGATGAFKVRVLEAAVVIDVQRLVLIEVAHQQLQ